MNSAPLPQPTAQTCPKCGVALAENVVFCPNCGATVKATANASSGWLNLLAQVALAILTVVFGLMGACFAFVGPAFFRAEGDSSSMWWMIAIGVVLFVLAFLCLKSAIKRGKTR